MSRAVPLYMHASPAAIVAWRSGSPVSAERLVSDARALAAQLPAASFVVNACTDRYRFAVGLAAAMLRSQVSVLPGNLLAHTLAQLRARFDDLYCLADEDVGAPLPRMRYPETLDEPGRARGAAGGSLEVPAFPADRLAAYLYTSGSTGEPLAHPRSWGSMVASGRAEAARLGLDPARPMAVLGTVPVQHSYGFESTLHLPLQGGGSLVAERPFYPADVFDALEALPRPRMLVTTPVHLRALLGAERKAPPADLLLCATSPLEAALAREAERRFAAPLHEIYGCTEAGQVATRRTADEQAWHALEGVELRADGDGARVRGGHVEVEVRLADLIEVRSPAEFMLGGRPSDMVNVAGKRSSIAFLDAQLLSVPGVRDGAFVAAPGTPDTARLTALAVAPGLSHAQLMSALRERIEPAFLPRPLHLVDALPREATGKLQRHRLQALADECSRRQGRARSAAARADAPSSGGDGGDFEIDVPARAAVFEGHFPGDPMLPGARVLDLVLRGLHAHGALAAGTPPGALTLGAVKFLAPVRPASRITVAWTRASDGAVSFRARVDATDVCAGQVRGARRG